jgi:hypothetical protein
MVGFNIKTTLIESPIQPVSPGRVGTFGSGGSIGEPFHQAITAAKYSGFYEYGFRPTELSF